MDLLTRMLEHQEAHGAVNDAFLAELAKAARVPLHRLEGLRGFYPVFRRTPGAPVQVRVCRDIACAMAGGADHAGQVLEALAGLPGLEVEAVSCLGRCDTAPACAINDVPVPGELPALQVLAERVAKDPAALPPDEPTSTPRRWPTDPYEDSSRHYDVLKGLLAEGPPGDAPATDAARERVLGALSESGLRGMGGAGFPTGSKWAYTRSAPGAVKYVVCNADESEPGTFKDRVILEELPHLVVEAMAIAGWVIGAREGIVYLRHEYGRERKALEREIASARAAGVLGGDTGFDLRVFISPGGYIQGEETALLEALEDRRGEPRNKPPFPTTHGLRGKPTLINNVETFAAVPIILERGAEWWAGQGLGESQGLKFLAVSGDIAEPGVVCVPMGTPVADLLKQCGGVPGGRALRAFAPGGASSNFLPADRLDVALDFQALQEAGSMLGSGAVIFVAEDRDLLAVALNEVRFFRNESCGKCVPCRMGTEKAVSLLEGALLQGTPGKAGNGAATDALPSLLQDLGATLARTSICGLGQVALQPVLSVLENFPEEAARLKGSVDPKIP